MSPFPPLFILRHGQTEWNAQGLLQGRFDSALTPLGRMQAATQHAILKRQDLTGFKAVVSPQGRAVETATLALNGMFDAVPTDDRLREIGLGDWAGASRADLMRETGARSGFELYEIAPAGEGFAHLRARCTEFLRDRKDPTVVVTHGITSRMLRLIVMGLPDSALTELPGGQGVIFQLSDGEQQMLSDRG